MKKSVMLACVMLGIGIGQAQADIITPYPPRLKALADSGNPVMQKLLVAVQKKDHGAMYSNVSAFTVNAETEEKGDIEATVPEWLNLPKVKQITPEEKQQNELREHVLRNLPYYMDYRALTTLGQLSKLCDRAFVGKMVKLNTKKLKKPFGENVNILQGDIDVTFQVETNLFGQFSNKPVKITVWWSGPQNGELELGKRTLVFFTKTKHLTTELGIQRFDFDNTKFAGGTQQGAFLVEGPAGLVPLDGGESETALLNAATGYLQVLRREKRDPEKYYILLRQLVLSPVPRIWDDAENDLAVLLRDVPSFDLFRVLADENIDDTIKDYVRFILLPERNTKKL
jgi:hypothetical protein